MTEIKPVLIVGGGPTGMMLAQSWCAVMCHAVLLTGKKAQH